MKFARFFITCGVLSTAFIFNTPVISKSYGINFSDITLKTLDAPSYKEDMILGEMLKEKLHTQKLRTVKNRLECYTNLVFENDIEIPPPFDYKNEEYLEILCAYLLQKMDDRIYLWSDYFFNEHVSVQSSTIYVRGEKAASWFKDFINHLKHLDDKFYEFVISQNLLFDYICATGKAREQHQKTQDILEFMQPSDQVRHLQKNLDKPRSLVISGNRTAKYFRKIDVSSLDLSLVELTVCIGPVFKKFQKLKKLDLYYNNFPELDIKDLKNLEELDAEGSGLKSIIGLDDLKKLKFVNLSHNNFTKKDLKSFTTQSFIKVPVENSVFTLMGRNVVLSYNENSDKTRNQERFILY